MNSLLIVSTSNELQPHLGNLLAHSMANINDNFWQAISVFMFQGECTVNLINLFSKPSTPNLTWTNPRKASWEITTTRPILLTTTRVWVCDFISLTSTSPPPPLFGQFYLGLVPCKLVLFGCECSYVIIRCCVGRNMPLTFDVMYVLHFWCVIYI